MDNAKNIIPINKSSFSMLYLSDISFSSNDYALNCLLTLLPRKLLVHVIDEEDEFINTLKLIFGERFSICRNCKICNMYSNKNIDYK